MAKFIEVRQLPSGAKRLVNAEKIIYVAPAGENGFIATAEKKNRYKGFYVLESYEELKARLRE